MKILMMMMMFMSTMFVMLKHPLSMGFNLILLTMIISFTMTLIMKYSWYSYILILVMLGGMLILFMYMASIASNEIMKFSMKMTILSLTIMTLSVLMFNNEMIMMNEMIIETLENPQNMSMKKLFNGQTSFMTMMMALYLLITMIYIIYITKSFEGPMRKKN
uniref:NADH-ubiquinone oxidoreductase chain 6 n=1 Tax=Ventidius harrisoni TaxID=3095940 RepID=A0AB38Z706_9HEMI|nr:NADH dehydrogenase subunit 6 [Ventidius harrisoni]WPW47149.1 NADH dehydrogenase subunit 6 [Ventidius harrisoni]WPW47162.1 NADH dehydrogenase subunit 6 [Ventidius harrisoni]